MSPSDRIPERRAFPRQPKAFAFWFRPAGGGQRTSAWMQDVSSGGAAFLTAADQAPAVDELLTFAEMPITDRTVRDDAMPLPARGRVVRQEQDGGVTRRVAVRFEEDQTAALHPPAPESPVKIRSAIPQMPPPPPPMPATMCHCAVSSAEREPVAPLTQRRHQAT